MGSEPSRCGYRYEDGTACGEIATHRFHQVSRHWRHHSFIPQEAPQEAESEGGLKPTPSEWTQRQLTATRCENHIPLTYAGDETVAVPVWLLKDVVHWLRAPESVPTDEARINQLEGAIAEIDQVVNGEIEVWQARSMVAEIVARVQPVSDTQKGYEREENERVLRAFIPLANDTPIASEEE